MYNISIVAIRLILMSKPCIEMRIKCLFRYYIALKCDISGHEFKTNTIKNAQVTLIHIRNFYYQEGYSIYLKRNLIYYSRENWNSMKVSRYRNKIFSQNLEWVWCLEKISILDYCFFFCISSKMFKNFKNKITYTRSRKHLSLR